MDKRNIFIVGGSCGIGLELAKLLSDNYHEVYLGSRTNERLAEIPDIHHLSVDASAEPHPLKRIGNAQDIARFAAHLLSDSGSQITGQIIQVDGGMSSLRVFR